MEKHAVCKVILKCNAKCQNCQSRKNEFNFRGKDTTMSLELFEDFCKEFKDNGGTSISISGGEPTILQNLERYIEIANECSLKTRLMTNGSYLTHEKIIKFIDAGLKELVVSFYSTNEENFNKLRNSEGLFNKTKNAIELLSNFSKELILIMQTIVSKVNYEDLPYILEYAYLKRFHYMWISLLENAKDLEQIRMADEDIDKYNNEIIPQLQNIIKNNCVDNYKENCKILSSNKMQKYYSKGLYKLNEYNCPFIKKFYLLYPNGDLGYCPGYEYFSGEKTNFFFDRLDKINYERIKAFLKEKCFYCPHGMHISLKIAPSLLINKSIAEDSYTIYHDGD